MTEELTSAAKTIEMLEPDDIKLDNCIKKLQIGRASCRERV